MLYINKPSDSYSLSETKCSVVNSFLDSHHSSMNSLLSSCLVLRWGTWSIRGKPRFLHLQGLQSPCQWVTKASKQSHLMCKRQTWRQVLELRAHRRGTQPRKAIFTGRIEDSVTDHLRSRAGDDALGEAGLCAVWQEIISRGESRLEQVLHSVAEPAY